MVSPKQKQQGNPSLRPLYTASHACRLPNLNVRLQSSSMADFESMHVRSHGALHRCHSRLNVLQKDGRGQSLCN